VGNLAIARQYRFIVGKRRPPVYSVAKVLIVRLNADHGQIQFARYSRPVPQSSARVNRRNNRFIHPRKLCALMQAWRSRKELTTPGFRWLRSLRPPPKPLGSRLLATLHHGDVVNSVALSPNETVIVSGSRDQTACVWDVATGQLRHRFRTHRSSVRSVAVTADGRTVISGSVDGTVRMWDAQSGEERRYLGRHTEPITSIALSLDGALALSSAEDGTVCLWNVQTGECRLRLSTQKGKCSALSRDGRMIAAAAHCAIFLWDAQTGLLLRRINGEQVLTITFSPDGKWIIGSFHSLSGGLGCWDVDSGELLKRFETDSLVVSMAVSADARTLAAGVLDAVWIWDVDSGTQRLRLLGHEQPVGSVGISADGRLVVSGSNDRTVRVWDLCRNDAGLHLAGNEEEVQSIMFAPPNGEYLLTTGHSAVRFWDPRTGICVRVFDEQGAGSVVENMKQFGKFNVKASGWYPDIDRAFRGNLYRDRDLLPYPPPWMTDNPEPETAIRSTLGAASWFPAYFEQDMIERHPREDTWAAAVRGSSHLYLFTLEGLSE
jgi:WD40 repeat protein